LADTPGTPQSALAWKGTYKKLPYLQVAGWTQP